MKSGFLLKGLVVFLLLIMSSPATATTNPETSDKNVEARALFLKSRLDNIKALYKSAMTHSEKKNLRKEVREIKKELAAVSGGIYLSVGAILLIALLLILLL